MTIYTCPTCNADVRDNRGAGLVLYANRGIVCPNGHKVTKAIKRARRLWRVQGRANAAGLTEAAYRERCRAEDMAASRWRRSPLFVDEADLRVAGVAIGEARRKG